MKLPDNFENDYFSLLTPVVTDGTIKNRRNLLVSAFSISLLNVLGKSIAELKVLGIDLKNTDSQVLLLGALGLILFWFIMFIIHAEKDKQINKERRHLLIKYTEKLKIQLDYAKDKFQDYDNEHPNKKQISEFQSEYDIFINQKKRTRKVNLLGVVAYIIEYSLPLLMGLWCFYLLVLELSKNT